MKSNYEELREQSDYHFNTSMIDHRYDGFRYIGRIENTWKYDLDDIIERSMPANWETRGSGNPIKKNISSEKLSDDLVKEELDLTNVGLDPKMVITNLEWGIPPSLKEISDRFALKDCMERIHVQLPGQIWNLHLDKLYKWNPDDPSKVIRIFIQLTDWKMGQFWNYGNVDYNMWKAGDVTTFDWQNVPHSTANAGYDPRVTFQLTGIVTDQTLRYMDSLR